MVYQGSGSYDVGAGNVAAGGLGRGSTAVFAVNRPGRTGAGPGNKKVRKVRTFGGSGLLLSHVDGDKGQQEHQHAANHG